MKLSILTESRVMMARTAVIPKPGLMLSQMTLSRFMRKNAVRFMVLPSASALSSALPLNQVQGRLRSSLDMRPLGTAMPIESEANPPLPAATATFLRGPQAASNKTNPIKPICILPIDFLLEHFRIPTRLQRRFPKRFRFTFIAQLFPCIASML